MDFLLFKYCTPDRAVQTPQWQILRVCAATSTTSAWMHPQKLFSVPLGKMLRGRRSLTSSIKPDLPATGPAAGTPPLLPSQQNHPAPEPPPHPIFPLCHPTYLAPRGGVNTTALKDDVTQTACLHRQRYPLRPGLLEQLAAGFVSLCPPGSTGQQGGRALLCCRQPAPHLWSPRAQPAPTEQAPWLILRQRTWASRFCPNTSHKTCWNTRKPCTWAPDETVLSDFFFFEVKDTW